MFKMDMCRERGIHDYFHFVPKPILNFDNYIFLIFTRHFPDGSDGKESTYNAVDLGSIPGLGKSPGGEHGNPLQYSCLESLEGYSTWDCKELDTTE